MICPWCDKNTTPVDGFCPSCGNEWITDFGTGEFNEVELGENIEMEHKMTCPRCSSEMTYAGEEKLQRGSSIENLFFGELGELFKGTVNLDAYICTECFKVEFELTNRDKKYIQQLRQSQMD